MAFQEGTETLTCPHCGTHHKASWHRLPVRDEQLVRCKACRKPMLHGKSVKDYFDVELANA